MITELKNLNIEMENNQRCQICNVRMPFEGQLERTTNIIKSSSS